MSEIQDRLIEALDYLDLTAPQLERRTGIKSTAWRNIRNSEMRVNEDHMTGLKAVAPEFVYWVVTGEELPESGQISPRTAETHQKLKEG